MLTDMFHRNAPSLLRLPLQVFAGTGEWWGGF
jgi:hypothetical protein